jgi:hypothetical protein
MTELHSTAPRKTAALHNGKKMFSRKWGFFFDCLTLEYGTDKLYQKVINSLPVYAA